MEPIEAVVDKLILIFFGSIILQNKDTIEFRIIEKQTKWQKFCIISLWQAQKVQTSRFNGPDGKSKRKTQMEKTSQTTYRDLLGKSLDRRKTNKINLRESSKCNICDDDIVEDLHHFIFECKTLRGIRQELFEEFVLWWKCSCMIYANFDILVVVYLWLLYN